MAFAHLAPRKDERAKRAPCRLSLKSCAATRPVSVYCARHQRTGRSRRSRGDRLPFGRDAERSDAERAAVLTDASRTALPPLPFGHLPQRGRRRRRRTPPAPHSPLCPSGISPKGGEGKGGLQGISPKGEKEKETDASRTPLPPLPSGHLPQRGRWERRPAGHLPQRGEGSMARGDAKRAGTTFPGWRVIRSTS